MKATDQGIEYYIGIAQQHGAHSDPDHEVGDLQAFLREAWAVLSESQRRAFEARSGVCEAVAAATGEDCVPAPDSTVLQPPRGGSGAADDDLIRVCVVMQGGVVQAAIANQALLVNIIDYDVEDSDHKTVLLEQDSGETAECLLWEFNAEIGPHWFERIDAAQAPVEQQDDADDVEGNEDSPRPAP